MVASGFFVFNVAPIHWCEQIKTKNTGLRSKARVSMLGLNQFLGKRVSVIPSRVSREICVTNFSD
jgi:stage III sporulation protein SpoIIIAA